MPNCEIYFPIFYETIHTSLKIFSQNGLRKCRQRLPKKKKKQNVRIFDQNLYLSCLRAFNLNDRTYKPYTKSNNEIKYIHKDSNHPPSSIYQIPLYTKSRMSTLSYNGKILQKVLTLTKRYCKTLAINTSSPLNVLTTITTVPT